jgi:GntR family transcriptional regulator, transcriptional repressor for pyruvate dehydrogenase complex
MELNLIWVQAMAARDACEQMTEATLRALRDSVDRASCLPARPGWERKAAAHAEIFGLLADVAGNPAAGQPGGPAATIQDVILTVGPAADGMIASSRRRLLAHLSAGEADGAALEMEAHLRVLHYMWRLAQPE